MADITLVKQNPMQVSEEDRATVNRVLCGVVDGLGELGKKQWRNFLSGLLKLEPGEIVSIKTHKARSGRFHRRHMAIETAVFEAQDRFTVFDQYLYWIKVGSGWVVWAAGSKGGVVPIPRSISYAQAEDSEFRQFHEQVMEFLRGPYAARYLWPHLKDKADAMMHSILEDFQE